MCPGVVQIPKYLDKETAVEGQVTKVCYTPSVSNEKKFLSAKNGDVRIAFTKFCPEHATTVHSGESCKTWLAHARQQAAFKEKRTAGYEAAQTFHKEKTERAFKSREAERRKAEVMAGCTSGMRHTARAMASR